MSFWSSFADLAKIFAPIIIAATVPGAGPVLGPLVGDLIGALETALGPGTGPTKKAAVQAAADVVTLANVAKGNIVADPAVVAGQVSTAIDLTISLINDVQKKAAVTGLPAPHP